jgi:macrophage erythroblast attacher
MAAELTATTKLDPDAHLLLDQPLLRLPHELLRKNLKTAQRQIEITHKGIDAHLDALKPATASPTDTLAALDATLAKAQSLKRKLEGLCEEERTLQRQQTARIEHLRQLHEMMPAGLGDVKYDAWSHTRLDRLLVDYLLRNGHVASAKQLAAAKGVEDLVDIAVFEECGRIEASLKGGEVKEALGWCGENKQALKKIGSNLELELRLQQFIELRRTGDMGRLMEAVVHARKHLVGGQDTEFGLLVALFEVTDASQRQCTPLTATPAWRPSSSKPTTPSSRSRPNPSCTSPCPPASPPSKHPPATPSTAPPPPLSPPPRPAAASAPQRASVRSVARS